jgi:hypothetical protein
VGVSIDVSHVMGINVKSNTMELLISLELDWYDDRLSWEPFLGGCYRASFRASQDPEQTEIWVPHLEVVNMAQSGDGLPEASASVMYDGKVMWRRTGVLTVTCELTGIENFPFDRTGYVCCLTSSAWSFYSSRDHATYRTRNSNNIIMIIHISSFLFLLSYYPGALSTLVELVILYSIASSIFPAGSSIRLG